MTEGRRKGEARTRTELKLNSRSGPYRDELQTKYRASLKAEGIVGIAADLLNAM